MKYIKYTLGVILLLVVGFFLIGVIKSEVSYQSEVIVDKPIAEAWAVSQDDSKLADWLEGYQRMEHVSGKPGQVGAVSDVYFLTDGQEMVIRETIKKLGPDESMAMTFEMDFMNMEYDMTMTDEGGKTKIASNTVVTGNGMIAKSIVGMMGSSMKAQEDNNMGKLKAAIEKNTKDYSNSVE